MAINLNVKPESTTSTKVECSITDAGGALPAGVTVVDNSVFIPVGTTDQIVLQLVNGPAGAMDWDQSNPFTTNPGGCPTGKGSVKGNFSIANVTNKTLTVNVTAAPARSVFFYRLRLRDANNVLRSCDPIIINT